METRMLFRSRKCYLEGESVHSLLAHDGVYSFVGG